MKGSLFLLKNHTVFVDMREEYEEEEGRKIFFGCHCPLWKKREMLCPRRNKNYVLFFVKIVPVIAVFSTF